MSTLPNILPTTKTGLFQNDEPPPISNKGGGNGHFDQLMKQALLPSAGKENSEIAQNLNGVKTGAAVLPSHPKSSKADPQPIVAKHADATAQSPAQPEVKNSAVNPENIPPPIPVPVSAPVAVAVELNLQAATDVSIASGSAEILPVPLVAKNIPKVPASLPVKNFSPAISQNQSATATDPKVKMDGSGKNPTVKKNPDTEISTAAKADSTTAKLAALTPVGEKISPPANVADAETKAPVLAIKTADDSAPDKFSTLSATDAKNVVVAPLIVNGTPTANQDAAMNNGEKANKTASLAGKFLPGDVAVVARGNDFSPRLDQGSTTAAVNSVAQNASATATQSAAEPVGISSVEDLRSQALERTHDLVALHALRLSDVGNDSLQVVIKPGAGTQLSLELRQRGDGIEAQAVLQQGDFKHLNQLWPELQQRLEQRGIKLASLTDDVSAGGNYGGEAFGQKQNQPVEAIAEFVVPVRGSFAAPVTQTASHLGWETWA